MNRIPRQANDIAKLRISLIVTTKNENRTISTLLASVAKQTRMPDEIILSIAGAYDTNVIVPYMRDLPLTIIELHASANRAVGRNRAIEKATHEHILITDAGCSLKEDWIEQMEAGFHRADVVAGFYEGESHTAFEKCQIPYVLVMPDKLDKKNFLPATRSMGITKTIWEKVGKLNEQLRFAEDYEFARRLKRFHVPIAVVPEAIVYWRSRPTLLSFARMLYEHAYGDGYSRTFRPKVLTIYGRYFFFILVGLLYGPWTMVPVTLYFAYAIQKSYRYVEDPKALGYLPVLQIVSDGAVMWGTLMGWNASR